MSQRLRVVAGGRPTDEQLAAIVVALTPVAVRADTEPAGPPPWRRAAILEAVGEPPISSAADLASRPRRG